MAQHILLKSRAGRLYCSDIVRKGSLKFCRVQFDFKSSLCKVCIGLLRCAIDCCMSFLLQLHILHILSCLLICYVFLHQELPDVPLFLSLHNLCATLKCTSPSAVIFRSAVINAGYRISGTHVNPLGLKSDAPMNVIWDIMRCWVRIIFLYIFCCLFCPRSEIRSEVSDIIFVRIGCFLSLFLSNLCKADISFCVR